MYVVELTFDRAHEEQRMAARPAHREVLAGLRADGRLLMAGPWDDESGALLIFRTDRAGVDEIMAADPYYAQPAVRVTAVRHWKPVVGGDPEA